jgi:hypothetical protein
MRHRLRKADRIRTAGKKNNGAIYVSGSPKKKFVELRARQSSKIKQK